MVKSYEALRSTLCIEIEVKNLSEQGTYNNSSTSRLIGHEFINKTL